MKEIILATGNQGKIKELQGLLSPLKCTPQKKYDISEADETGLTFIENALIKARHASSIAQMPALADDSGLVVLALEGRPGIYSSRFAGPDASDQDNIDKLLTELKDTPEYLRQAYFYCTMVLIEHPKDPTPIIATGKIEGVISTHATGEHGFGYDPVFFLPNHQKTMADLEDHVKNKISHRAIAMKSLLAQLIEF